MNENFSWFVGIDCSVDNYQICLVDTGGRVVSERTVPHNGSGISRFLDWLIEQTSNSVGQVAVAIETPRLIGIVDRPITRKHMGAFIGHIADCQRERRADLMLYGDVPSIHCGQTDLARKSKGGNLVGER
jgi:hypothetical protein